MINIMIRIARTLGPEEPFSHLGWSQTQSTSPAGNLGGNAGMIMENSCSVVPHCAGEHPPGLPALDKGPIAKVHRS